MKNNTIKFNETNDFLVSLISSAPYGILAFNKKGLISIANYLAKDYLKLPYDVKYLPNKDIIQCLKHIPELKELVEKSLHKIHKAINLDAFSYNNKYLNIKGRNIHDGYLITIEDISRIKEMEVVSLNSMLEGQEQERRRIAQEIHDGIGPLLSTIKLNLETIASDLNEQTSAAVLNNIHSTSEILDSAAEDLRSISRDLMPKLLIDFGLTEAFDNLCRRINNTKKIKVNFYHSLEKERLDNLTELGLYRIGQELLNNALKHSGASVINIQLIQHPNSIVLMIEDNGKGFDPNILNTENRGLGLINVESRAKAFGGDFFIDSINGEGVTATVEIPLSCEE